MIRATEQDRPDVQARRAWWLAEMLGIDPRRLVFIDKTGANTKMTRRYGRARRGQRVVGKLPHGHWITTTFVAALRHDGLTAPLVVDGPMNGDVFLAYIQQQVAPTLQPGDVVIMDNLAAHKKAGVREAIESRGASLVYLPPYSPDFNPIELAFEKTEVAAPQRRGTDDPQSLESPRKTARPIQFVRCRRAFMSGASHSSRVGLGAIPGHWRDNRVASRLASAQFTIPATIAWRYEAEVDYRISRKTWTSILSSIGNAR